MAGKPAFHTQAQGLRGQLPDTVVPWQIFWSQRRPIEHTCCLAKGRRKLDSGNGARGGYEKVHLLPYEHCPATKLSSMLKRGTVEQCQKACDQIRRPNKARGRVNEH